MIVQHNMTAANANRNYNVVTKNKNKSMEKLSSGYRINRAADDAAGLSISEKLRYQVRGLDQASENVQDGISLVQVAEGALNETQSVLQRMRELAVQAANDTNTSTDRVAIQSEVDELTKEIDRIARSTNFNGDIYPLIGGKLETAAVNSTFLLDGNVTEQTCIMTNMALDQLPQTWDGIECQYGASHTFTYINIYTPGNNFSNHVFDIGAPFTLDGSLLSSTYTTDHFEDNRYSLKYSDLKTDDEGYVYFVSKQDGLKHYISYRLHNNIPSSLTLPTSKGDSGFTYLMNPTHYTSDLLIQAGAQSGQTITLKMVDATVDGIGLGQVDVTSHTSASASLSNIDAALAKVSEYRSSFGASQNRLEHATNNIKNTEENTQAAESRIRDADIAEEMQQFSVTNILAQAGESVLAQANQSLSNVLTLLQ